MNFTNLNNQFNDFWSKHDYNGAMNALKSSYDWMLSTGYWSIPFSSTMLQANYLYYYAESQFYDYFPNQDITTLDNWSYSDFLNFWNEQHKAAVNSLERQLAAANALDALNQIKNFESIFQSIITGALDILSNPILYLGIGLIIYFVFIKSN